MIKYTIEFDSSLRRNLSDDFRTCYPNNTIGEWITYLELVHNVTHLDTRSNGYEVCFRTEEDLTFFLLRWS
jgi:hypothetical protein